MEDESLYDVLSVLNQDDLSSEDERTDELCVRAYIKVDALFDELLKHDEIWLLLELIKFLNDLAVNRENLPSSQYIDEDILYIAKLLKQKIDQLIVSKNIEQEGYFQHEFLQSLILDFSTCVYILSTFKDTNSLINCYLQISLQEQEIRNIGEQQAVANAIRSSEMFDAQSNVISNDKNSVKEVNLNLSTLPCNNTKLLKIVMSNYIKKLVALDPSFNYEYKDIVSQVVSAMPAFPKAMIPTAVDCFDDLYILNNTVLNCITEVLEDLGLTQIVKSFAKLYLDEYKGNDFESIINNELMDEDKLDQMIAQYYAQ